MWCLRLDLDPFIFGIVMLNLYLAFLSFFPLIVPRSLLVASTTHFFPRLIWETKFTLNIAYVWQACIELRFDAE